MANGSDIQRMFLGLAGLGAGITGQTQGFQSLLADRRLREQTEIEQEQQAFVNRLAMDKILLDLAADSPEDVAAKLLSRVQTPELQGQTGIFKREAPATDPIRRRAQLEAKENLTTAEQTELNEIVAKVEREAREGEAKIAKTQAETRREGILTQKAAAETEEIARSLSAPPAQPEPKDQFERLMQNLGLPEETKQQFRRAKLTGDLKRTTNEIAADLLEKGLQAGGLDKLSDVEKNVLNVARQISVQGQFLGGTSTFGQPTVSPEVVSDIANQIEPAGTSAGAVDGRTAESLQRAIDQKLITPEDARASWEAARSQAAQQGDAVNLERLISIGVEMGYIR